MIHLLHAQLAAAVIAIRHGRDVRRKLGQVGIGHDFRAYTDREYADLIQRLGDTGVHAYAQHCCEDTASALDGDGEELEGPSIANVKSQPLHGQITV